MEEEKKVYIGNLEFSVTEDELKKFFEENEVNVKEIKIISDKFSGRSKGFGFGEFETEDDARKAIDTLNEKDFKGRPLRVSKAKKMQPRQDRNNRY